MKTLHNLLNLNLEQRKILDSFCDLYSSVKHKAFAIISKNNKINSSLKTITQLSSKEKTELGLKYDLNSRHINSINLGLQGNVSSIIELRQLYFTELKEELKTIEKHISSYNTKNSKIIKNNSVLQENNKFYIKQLNAYHNYLIEYKSNKKLSQSAKLFKPKFIFYTSTAEQNKYPQIITKEKQLKILTEDLKLDKDKTLLFKTVQTYCYNFYKIKTLAQKKQRLQVKINRIEKDIKNHKIRLCFGTKQLFKQQSILQNVDSFIDNNVFNHEAYYDYLKSSQIKYKSQFSWGRAWIDARAHEFLLSGAKEEPQGNQNCGLFYNNDKNSFDLRITLPEAVVKQFPNSAYIEDNKYLWIKNIEFDKAMKKKLALTLNKNKNLISSDNSSNATDILEKLTFTKELKNILASERKTVRILSEKDKEEIKTLKESSYELGKKKFFHLKELSKLQKDKNNLSLNQDRINLLEKEIQCLTKEIENVSLQIKEKSDIFNFDNNENIKTRVKRCGHALSYRFVKNIDTCSPKYGQWSFHIMYEEEVKSTITTIENGMIGIDLNYSHVSVSETDSKGKLLQSFNLYFNKNTNKCIDLDCQSKSNKFVYNDKNNLDELSKKNLTDYYKKKDPHTFNKYLKPTDNQMRFILGNILNIITDLSLKTGKPIAIEELDFSQKKRQLKFKNDNKKNNGFNYADMLSSFAYSKFKEILLSQAKRKGLQLVEVNPMYTSLIGQINYVKTYGLSVHMAASYVIAKRGLEKLKSNNKSTKFKITEKLIFKNDNNKNIEIHYQGSLHQLNYTVSNDLAEEEDIFKLWQCISKLYNDFKRNYYRQKLMFQKNKSNFEVDKINIDQLEYETLFNDFQINSFPHNPRNQQPQGF